MEKQKNKFIRRIVYCLMLIIILVILHGAFKYYYKIYYDEQLSCRVTKDVIEINDFFSSMHLIKTDEGYIAVDAGYIENVVRKGLEYNNIKPEEIKFVLLTHLDWDHQGALNIFTKAKIFIPEKELDAVKNKTPRFKYLSFSSPSINASNYSLLRNEDVFNINERKVKCFSLPGHTTGSMGYIIDNKYLFSGDAFRLKNGIISLPDKKMFVNNLDSMKASIKKVSKLIGIEYLFTSNSGFTADFPFAVSH